MRPLTVAMVAACPFPANHGTPAAIREMSEALADRGHSIHVVTYPLKDDIPIQGVTIHRTRPVGKNEQIVVGPSYQRLVFDALMISKLWGVIRKHQVDIIHAHNYEGALVGYAVKKLTGIPLLYNAINTMITELPQYGFIRPKSLAISLANFLDRFVPKMADFIIADTEDLMSFIMDKGIPQNRIRVVPSGVNIEMFEKGDGQKVRKAYQIGERPLVIYTGTFDQFQGLDYLFQAFKIVVDRVPDGVLLLVGSTVNPEHEEKYKRMAGELGLAGNVIITTSSLDDLPDFLAAADVAVVPRPFSPGIPTKLLNYMAAAKPVVSFEGSAKFLKDGVNALLVKGKDSFEFGQAIVRLITDKPLAQELGANIKASIKGTFDWNTIAKKIEQIYTSMLS